MKEQRLQTELVFHPLQFEVNSALTGNCDYRSVGIEIIGKVQTFRIMHILPFLALRMKHPVIFTVISATDDNIIHSRKKKPPHTA